LIFRAAQRSCNEPTYDSLIIATGVSHHYFGNDDWEKVAPGLKTVENALEIRRRILLHLKLQKGS